MKASIKLAILGLAVVGGAAQAANINSSLTDASGSSLILMLKDSTNNTYLNFELNTKVFDLDSKASLASVPNGQYSLDGDSVTGGMTLTSELNGWSNANLTNYLSANAGHSIQWTILGGAFNSNVYQAAGNDLVLTSTIDHLNAFWTSDQVNTAVSATGMQYTISQINQATVVNNANGTAGYTGLAPGSYSGAAGNGAALGAGQSLYLLSSGSDPSLAANVYKSLGLLTLSSTGLLSYNGTDIAQTATPIPAALWLLGSGLMGLVGIGRRRNVALAA